MEQVPEVVVENVIEVIDTVAEVVEPVPEVVESVPEPDVEPVAAPEQVVQAVKNRLRGVIRAKLLNKPSIDSVMDKVMLQLDDMINKIVEDT